MKIFSSEIYFSPIISRATGFLILNRQTWDGSVTTKNTTITLVRF